MLKLSQAYTGPIHSSVNDFVKGIGPIKANRATLGSYMTKHMADPGFQRILQQHPQAAQIRTLVNKHLNSPANMVGSVVKASSITMSAFYDEAEKIAGIFSKTLSTMPLLQRIGVRKSAQDALIALRAAAKISGMSDKISPKDIKPFQNVPVHQPQRTATLFHSSSLPSHGAVKTASGDAPLWHSLSDLAGLGVLGYPTIQKMRKKKVSDRAIHAAEVGGLALLAAPVIHNLIKKVHGH